MNTDFTRQINPLTAVLRRYALQLTKDPDDAGDLVQDTLLKAFRYWSYYEPGTNLKAWLMTIMRNTFYTQYKRNHSRRLVPYYSQESPRLPTLGDVSNGASASLLLEDVMGAVNGLNPVYSQPLLLHVQGYKYYEIANQLAIPIGTVKNRIHQARQRLQSTLSLYRNE